MRSMNVLPVGAFTTLCAFPPAIMYYVDLCLHASAFTCIFLREFVRTVRSQGYVRATGRRVHASSDHVYTVVLHTHCNYI